MASADVGRQAIQFLHMWIAEHGDPQAKAQLAQCLQLMLKVQAQDHAQVGDQAQSTLQSMLGGR